MADYIAYLHKDSGSDYGVSFPDFPGAITAGRTLDEAKDLAREVLNLHIRGMLQDGEAIPQPSTLEDLAQDPVLQGAVAFLVSNDIPGRTVRFNVTAQEAQLRAIDNEARAAGLSRSAYMVQASLLRKLNAPKRQKLPRTSPDRSAAETRTGQSRRTMGK